MLGGERNETSAIKFTMLVSSDHDLVEDSLSSAGSDRGTSLFDFCRARQL